MLVEFKLRRGHSSVWTEKNPVLDAGEPGLEIDSGLFKVGDGISSWSTLEYYLTAPATSQMIAEMIEEAVIEGSPGPQGPPGADGAQGPPGPSSEVYPISAYGFVSVSMNIEAARLSTSFGNWVTRLWVPANKVVTKVGVYVTTIGATGSGLNSFAVYSDGGDLLQSTPTDNNLWTDEGWTIRSLSSPISAEESGRFIRVAVALNGSSPNVLYASHDGPATAYNGGDVTHRRAYAVTSRSSWPSTINPATEGEDFPYLPLVVLA